MKIIKHCERHNWPEGQHADHTEPCYSPDTYEVDDKYHLTWLIPFKSAVDDICNVRQVCKTMNAAAFESFGTMLGARHFRFSETSLQDLQDIAANTALTPYIKSLTFASTVFTEWQCRRSATKPHEHVRLKPGPKIWSDSSGANDAVKRFKALPTSLVENKLVDILRAFYKLTHLRIAGPNPDIADFVIAWVKPDGQPCSAIWNDRESEHEMHYVDDIGLDSVNEKVYKTEGYEVANTVLRALEKVGIDLQDFRTCSSFWLWSLNNRLLPETLRTLRLTVHASDLGATFPDPQYSSLQAVLAKMRHLEDLSLTLNESYSFEQSTDYHEEWEEDSKVLFQAIRQAPRLRRVALHGEWAYRQASLLKFVEQHSSSLRCFILYGGILNGHWLQTLHEIAELTRDTLEYLSVTFVYHIQQNGLIGIEKFERYTESGWPHFTCTTNFGPTFRLLPDSNDEDGNIMEGTGYDAGIVI